MEKGSVMIGLSGGVDSSVAAWLLLQQGWRCGGGTMELFEGAPDNAADARAVAQTLGIPFHTMDLSGLFRERVLEPFTACYEAGQTPNPCIFCNRHLKFDAMLNQARLLGYDNIATGHYARILPDPESGRYLLYKGVDTSKDQTYFLYSLTQQQLAYTRFPLGDLTKEQVREIAAREGFINARKRDSQDICFIPDGDYAAFIRRFRNVTFPEGDFLNLQGQPVGRHCGAIGYTLGQRKGLGLAMGTPVYVCAKDMAANTVTVGPEDALFSSSLLVEDWNWIAFPELTVPIQVQAKARSRHQPQAATVYPLADGKARVEFAQPQRALTPGQAVVLYQGDQVLGGGTITKIL